MRRVGAVLLLKPILSLALTMHHIASRRVVRAAARAAGPRKAAREPCVVEDVEGLCGAYDTILLDQFGVVHDGKVPYDGAPELVRRLQRAGKRVVVLSNSSKRRRDTIERLEAMGCGAGTLRDRADTPDGRPAISAVTSGDLVHDALAARARGAPAPLLDGVAGPAGRGLRAFVFGNGDDDEAYLVSCGVAPARVEGARPDVRPCQSRVLEASVHGGESRVRPHGFSSSSAKPFKGNIRQSMDLISACLQH